MISRISPSRAARPTFCDATMIRSPTCVAMVAPPLWSGLGTAQRAMVGRCNGRSILVREGLDQPPGPSLRFAAASGSLGAPADPAPDGPLILVHQSAHLGVQRDGLRGAGGCLGVAALGGTPRGEQLRGRRRHLLTPKATTVLVIAATPGWLDWLARRCLRWTSWRACQVTMARTAMQDEIRSKRDPSLWPWPRDDRASEITSMPWCRAPIAKRPPAEACASRCVPETWSPVTW